MKLNGIWSSKGRRAVWERNNEPPPQPEPVQEGTHKPQPGPDGTQYCCGHTPMTPGALKQHMMGRSLPMSCGGVLVDGADDPWLAEQDKKQMERRETTDDEAARIRLEQINLHYEEQARPRREPRQADGASTWLAE